MEEENTHISHLSCHPPLTEGINGCHTQDDIDKIDGDKTRKRKVTPEQRERQRKGKTSKFMKVNCHVYSLQLQRFMVSCAVLCVR